MEFYDKFIKVSNWFDCNRCGINDIVGDFIHNFDEVCFNMKEEIILFIVIYFIVFFFYSTPFLQLLTSHKTSMNAMNDVKKG